MMPMRLSTRDSRTLLGGVAVIAMIFGGARGAPALLAWGQTQRTAALAILADASAARAALGHLAAHRDTLQARAQRLAERDSSLLTGASAVAAVANLSGALDDIADEARIKVTTTQLLRADTGGSRGLARVGVRMMGVADVAGLAALLRTVEGGDTPLVVRDVTVSQSEPGAAEAKAEALRFEVVVEGVARIVPSRQR